MSPAKISSWVLFFPWSPTAEKDVATMAVTMAVPLSENPENTSAAAE
jgi:hypothetical protein